MNEAQSNVPADRGRRGVILGAGSAFALLAASPTLVSAQRARGPAEVPIADLMKPSGLPELLIGNKDARVTIVEYASLTCGHCANFHNNVFPGLKAKYIDTGKIAFIKREYPLDNLAAAGAMLARCAGEGKAYDVVSVLFAKQDQWAIRGNALPRLFEIAKQLGFTQETFDKCLTDQKLLDQIAAVRSRASETFGVNSTPTFFINGKRLEGRTDQLATFEAVLEPLLKNA